MTELQRYMLARIRLLKHKLNRSNLMGPVDCAEVTEMNGRIVELIDCLHESGLSTDEINKAIRD